MSRLRRKLFRDVKSSKWQFIAVTVIVALGIAFYGGLYSSFQNLKASVEYPYDELNFADFSVSFEPSPKDNVTREIELVQGVRDFEGRLILEIPVAFSIEAQEFISGRIISFPDTHRPSVNDVLVVQGNYFYGDGRDEILLEIAFAKHHNLTVGDMVYVKTGEQLKSFEVVGRVISPEYIWPAKNIIEHMPDVLRKWGVFFMPESLVEKYFNYTGSVNEVSVSIEDSNDPEAVAEEVESVLTPFGVNKVVTRETQPSHRIIMDMMIGSLDSLALIFPIFFLIVAALSTYIVLTRKVYLQAREIGALLAIGFTKRKILLHYLGFALLIGLLGSLVGSLTGYLMSYPVTELFATQMNLPLVRIEVYWITVLAGILSSLAFTGIAGLVPAWTAAKQRPAESMRAQKPISGRTPLIEKVLPFFSKLPSSWKVSYRNIFRNRRRSLFTSIGIALSLSLILVPASFNDSMDAAVIKYFDKIQTYDVKAVFMQTQNMSVVSDIDVWSGVDKVEPYIETSLRLTTDDETRNTVVKGILKDANLYNLYLISAEPISVNDEGIMLSRAFKDRTTITTDDTVELDLQPILTEYWREMNKTRNKIYAQVYSNVSYSLGPNATDLEIKRLTEELTDDYLEEIINENPPPQKTVQIRVAGFVDDPSGYAGFLPLGKVQEIFGLDDKVTGAMIKLSNSTYEKEVKERLYQDYPVLFVESSKETKKDWVAMLDLYTGFIGTILSFGVAIALAIIFNTVTISILERGREFGTMRTFGMGIRRIASIIAIENLLIVVLGIIFGLPLGKILAEYFLGLFSGEFFSFNAVIYLQTYVLTAIGIFVVLLLSEIPGIRHVYRLSLAKITKELVS